MLLITCCDSVLNTYDKMAFERKVSDYPLNSACDCVVCHKGVHHDQDALCCDKCNGWQHRECNILVTLTFN